MHASKRTKITPQTNKKDKTPHPYSSGKKILGDITNTERKKKKEKTREIEYAPGEDNYTNLLEEDDIIGETSYLLKPKIKKLFDRKNFYIPVENVDNDEDKDESHLYLNGIAEEWDPFDEVFFYKTEECE